MNQINVIMPYRFLGMWVFDDKGLGLFQEPFVGSSNEIIDALVGNIPDADKGFLLVFSEEKFPGWSASLEWSRSEFGGDWYLCRELGILGWLCPALSRYFRIIPKIIYLLPRPTSK